jgi:putative toxin-antitoxin system antitoxin component (TIGR02293 family)
MADLVYSSDQRNLVSKPVAPPSPERRTAHYVSRGASIGVRASHTPELIQQMRKGLPFRALRTFSTETGFPPSTIAAALGIPERTLARRRHAGRLAPDESERLLRISTVFEKAVALFEGDVDAALNWLTTPSRALSDNTPWEYARFEPGARDVEDLIGRMEHGVFT